MSVTNFYQNVDYYLDLFDERCDAGDYPGGFAALYYAKKVAEEDDLSDIYLAAAQGYAEIDRLQSSNEYYFKTLKSGLNRSEALFGLLQNMILLNSDEAEYYAAMLATEEEEFDEEALFDILDQAGAEQSDLRYELVYDKDEAATDRAAECVRNGKFDEAISILSGVLPTDKNYVKAQNDLTMCQTVKRDFEAALLAAENALSVEPENVVALSNKIMLSKILKKGGNVDEFVEKLLSKKNVTPFEAAKIATTMCDLMRHADARKYLLKVLEDKPYTELYMLLLGIAEYNLSNFSAAKREFDKLLKLDEKDVVAKYYMRFVNKKEEEFKSGKAIEEIEYVPQLPYAEILRLYKKVEKIVKSKNAEKFITDEEAKDAFEFMLRSGDMGALAEVCELVANSDVPQREEFLEEVLLDSTVSQGLKIRIIETLVYDKINKLYYTNDLHYEEVPLKYPKGYKNLPFAYRKAYAMAISLYAFLKSADYLKRFPSAANEIFSRFSESNKEFDSPEALAILICKVADNKCPAKELAEALRIDEELFKLYEEKLYE